MTVVNKVHAAFARTFAINVGGDCQFSTVTPVRKFRKMWGNFWWEIETWLGLIEEVGVTDRFWYHFHKSKLQRIWSNHVKDLKGFKSHLIVFKWQLTLICIFFIFPHQTQWGSNLNYILCRLIKSHWF